MAAKKAAEGIIPLTVFLFLKNLDGFMSLLLLDLGCL